MPLDARKVAHIAANRTRIRVGRSETVVLIAAGNGTTGTQVVSDAVWHDRHDGGPVAVPYGGPNGAGNTNRGSVAWDATVELPGSVSLPTDLRYVARTASVAGISNAPRYAVLDAIRAGLGTTASAGLTAITASGNRWRLHLRRLP